MHSLHRILVSVKQFGETERDDMISAVRSHAESVTESFYETAYDWRETDSAGRWSEIYPENVMLGSEYPERIVNEVITCKALQKSELEMCLWILKGLANCTLNELTQRLWRSDEEESVPSEADFIAPFLIKNIGKILDGDYFFDSYFYDTYHYTAHITKSTIDAIKQNPQDWAIAFFDYHY